MKKPQILIVEDESIIAMDIEEALLSLNYVVVGKVANSKDALELAAEKKPDLVLMDIYLEGDVDGIETAAIIKKLHNIPVVFLTAYADKSTLDRAKIVEPYGYVLKPFRQTELRTVIELALHKHNSELERLKNSPLSELREEGVKIPDFQELIPNCHKPSQSMQVTIKNFLSSVSPLSNLPTELIEKISACSIINTYSANSSIIHESSEQKEGFIIISGRISVFKTSSGGKELVVELLGPQDLFGYLTVLDKAKFPFSARAQIESRILWIPREIIYHITDNYNEVSKDLFQKVLERLRKAHDFSRSLAHDKVEVRVASALLAMIDNTGTHNAESDIPELEMTRQEMGELVGTAPETISRILNKLQTDGIVDLSSTGKVLISNAEKLNELIKNG